MLSRLVGLLGHMDRSAVGDVEKLHFIYQSVMEHGYKLRNDDAQWLEIVVWAAKAQVEVARQVAEAMESDYPAGVLRTRSPSSGDPSPGRVRDRSYRYLS